MKIKLLFIITIVALSLAGCTAFKLDKEKGIILGTDPRVFTATQGGTGIGSATVGDVGDCLSVSDDSPFTYTLGTCGSGGGGSNWEATTWGVDLTPTSSSAGIFVNASSTFNSTLRVNDKLYLPDGDLSTPVLTFSSDPDTGIYWDGNANKIVFGDGGSEAMSLAQNGEDRKSVV